MSEGDGATAQIIPAAAVGSRAVVIAARVPIRAGWLVLGLEAPAPRAVRLVLWHGAVDGTEPRTVEHVVDFRRGEVERVLHVAWPVLRADVAPVSEQDASVRSASLRPLGPIKLLMAALARDRGEALAAVGWRIVGKRVRARNRLLRLFGQTHRAAYEQWLAREVLPGGAATYGATDAAGGERKTEERLRGPRLVVVRACESEGGGAGDASTASQHSVGMPASPGRPVHREPVRVVASSWRARDILAAAGDVQDWDWLVLVAEGTHLARDTLDRIAEAVHAHPQARALYGDSDALAADGTRRGPHFTPQWNEALFLAQDYVGPFAVSRSAISEMVDTLDADDTRDALLLEAARGGAGRVVRLARMLSHRAIEGNGTADAIERRRATIERYLRRGGDPARVVRASVGLRVVRALPEPPPLVSLIVPTRDRLDLLKPCIESLRHRTDYRALEILIADNGSRERATLDYFASLKEDERVRVLACPGPFNFAVINNAAVGVASGTVVGFVNNDIETVHADWLTEMVAHAVSPQVGAVGALLVYPNGLVQHAGVTMGIGGYAGHAHRFFHPDAPGYMGRIACQHYVAAVTAACLVVERAKFEAVGGFDAEAFAVAYNDVDLCLKLRAAGYENLYTPFARLTHKESASRVRDFAPERAEAYARECAALVARWGDVIADDPYYHPALTRADETFSLD